MLVAPAGLGRATTRVREWQSLCAMHMRSRNTYRCVATVEMACWTIYLMVQLQTRTNEVLRGKGLRRNIYIFARAMLRPNMHSRIATFKHLGSGCADIQHIRPADAPK